MSKLERLIFEILAAVIFGFLLIGGIEILYVLGVLFIPERIVF